MSGDYMCGKALDSHATKTALLGMDINLQLTAEQSAQLSDPAASEGQSKQ
ncbi:hypothetical protein SFC07_08975 [Corynebacterium callunae]